MAKDLDQERSYRIRGLSEFQSGIVFLFIATALILYVAYQLDVGRVFTKSGDMPLGSGLSWGWLTIESYASIVGVVRGVRMIRR